MGNIALTFVFLSTEQKENCSRSTVKCNENKVKSFYTWHPKIIVTIFLGYKTIKTRTSWGRAVPSSGQAKLDL